MSNRRPSGVGPRAAAGVAILGLCGVALCGSVAAQTVSDLALTKHNLSASGPGPIRALTETRICVFCHTPHNAAPASPLWNKELEPQAYAVYTSPTLRAGPLPQPSGPTKLCLSCHDGTIAMGAVLNPATGISVAGGGMLPPDGLTNLGLDLSGHHPVSFEYEASLPNADLVAPPPADLTFGGAGEVHCTTCHDPHNDLYGRFLVKDNRYSALCTTCHQIPGWRSSAHARSTVSVSGILPRPPKTWPNYTQLGEWGCETCHTPHFAPTAEGLLNFTAAEPQFSCATSGCHRAEPPPPHDLGLAGTAPSTMGSGVALGLVRATGAPADIAGQVRKVSAHRELRGMVTASPRGPRTLRSSGGPAAVGCSDCHNPHLVSRQPVDPPYASGLLRGVPGVDRNGGIVREITYEYELCFKCHADGAPDLDYVPRAVGGTNTRLAFAPDNPSYHPVVAPGRELNVPSIPSTFEPALNASEMIACTSCHADDEGGARGPHGSSFAPILKERYETTAGMPESYNSYALCYRCHSRDSILRDDSFRKQSFPTKPSAGGHSGHLAAGAPCSACHDPHGVYEVGTGDSGSHTHLINFDVRIVGPAEGKAYPLFEDRGSFSGSCTLMCHGVAHNGVAYP